MTAVRLLWPARRFPAPRALSMPHPEDEGALPAWPDCRSDAGVGELNAVYFVWPATTTRWPYAVERGDYVIPVSRETCRCGANSSGTDRPQKAPISLGSRADSATVLGSILADVCCGWRVWAFAPWPQLPTGWPGRFHGPEHPGARCPLLRDGLLCCPAVWEG